jgi:hypothetical protein
MILKGCPWISWLWKISFFSKEFEVYKSLMMEKMISFKIINIWAHSSKFFNLFDVLDLFCQIDPIFIFWHGFFTRPDWLISRE